MPFQLRSEQNSIYRCEVCGKLVLNPLVFKTCCMNKPVYFCSKNCMQKWFMEWTRNQDQIFKGSRRLRRMAL